MRKRRVDTNGEWSGEDSEERWERGKVYESHG